MSFYRIKVGILVSFSLVSKIGTVNLLNLVRNLYAVDKSSKNGERIHSEEKREKASIYRQLPENQS